MIVNYADAEIDGNWVPAEATTIVQAGGFTTLNKRSGVGIIEPVHGEADNTWVVRLESHDSTTQEFTDVIDVLPYDDDVPPQLADSGWDGAAATWALLASAGLISAGAWLTAASRSRAAIRR